MARAQVPEYDDRMSYQVDRVSDSSVQERTLCEHIG
jgi:hypothetical protein